MENLHLLRLSLESLLLRLLRLITSVSSNITTKNYLDNTKDGPLSRSPLLLNFFGRKRKEIPRFRKEEKADLELAKLSVEGDGSESKEL